MELDKYILIIVACVFAVIGHGTVMWYKMGKIEAKLEMLMKCVFDGESHGS